MLTVKTLFSAKKVRNVELESAKIAGVNTKERKSVSNAKFTKTKKDLLLEDLLDLLKALDKLEVLR
jgi:hypothetical protein